VKKGDKLHSLGNYADVSRRDCAVCRLVVRIIQLDANAKAKINENGNIACGLMWTISDHFEYHTSLPTVDFYMNKQPPALAVVLPDISVRCSKTIEWFSDVGRCDEFQARIYEAEKLDVGLIKAWLRCCEEWHGTCERACIFPANAAPKLSEFRLIDVDLQQLVGFNSVHEGPYVALSYVWGSTNTFLTTKSNLAAFSKHHGLRPFLKDIPKTIMDAMILVKELGIRYLWVDSICIVQDEKDLKASAIEEMHHIYNRSFLTIMAGDGNHADFGLPGVRPGTREHQELEEIEPGFFLGVLPDFGLLLRQFANSQRAWT
jgi:hypothetical protein